MFTPKPIALLLLLTAAASTQASDPNSAPCLSLISSVSSCTAKSTAFYATVTDNSAAMATASACLCTSAQAFESGISACESYVKTSRAALTSALGASVNAGDLVDYAGLCGAGGAMSTMAGSAAASASFPQTTGTGSAVATGSSNGTMPTHLSPVPFTGAGNSKAGSAAAAVLVGFLGFFY